MQQPRFERPKQSHIKYSILQALSHGEGKNIKPYYDIYASLSEEAQSEIDDYCTTLLESMKQRRYGRSTGMGETSAFLLVMRLLMAAAAHPDFQRDPLRAWKCVDWQKVEKA